MNRAKAETIADRIMTRIETDKAIHKDAIADEIQAGDALDEIVDIISHDGEKWVHRDGTPFDTDADVKREGISAALMDLLTTGISITRVDPKRFFDTSLGPNGTPFVSQIIYRDGKCYQFTGSRWAHLPALDIDDKGTA